MPTLPKPSESSFVPCPPGSYVARCIGVVDLGTHQEQYDGETFTRHQVMITFETPAELMDSGEPYTISGWYTWSMNERAKLRIHLEQWRGKAFTDADFGEGGFEIRNILGVPAMITVGLTSGGKSKLVNVAPMPKGMTAPEQVNPSRYLFIDSEEWNQDVFDHLAETLQERIKTSPEYAAMIGKGSFDGTEEPQIDFDAPDVNEVPF